jgi:hypothetical protein
MEEHIKLMVGRECDELAIKFRELNEYLKSVGSFYKGSDHSDSASNKILDFDYI